MMTELAVPSPNDQPISFRRNEKTFPWREIPIDYPLAERFDGIINDIPRASYFRLSSETVGKPIGERVAASLQHTFEFEVKNGRNGRDNKFAKMQLEWARKSEEEGNWTAAVQHAAEVYTTGRARYKRAAQRVLSQVLTSAKNYKDFAPAKKINTLTNTDIGPITIPAAITDWRDHRHIRWNPKNSLRL